MKKISLILFFLALLSAACAPDAAALPASLTAWIDAPLHESTIPLAPYEIVAHGSDPLQIQRLEISVDGEVLGLIENPDPAKLLLTTKLAWTPPAPGVYTIEARGQNGGGAWSSSARIWVIVAEEFPTQSALELLPTGTPIEPTLEILPTGTPTIELATCEPEIAASTNTTCRQGPTTFNEPLAYLLEGETAPILGGNQDLSWWAIQPESLGEPCWVSGQTVETHCLPEEPEVVDAPPYITRVFPSYEEFYWGDHPLRSVTIQAQSAGEIPVTGVRLIYHLAGNPDWYNTAMIAADGEIWQASIDAHTFKNYRQVSAAVVEYYLEAVNEAGLITRSPIFNNLKLKAVP